MIIILKGWVGVLTCSNLQVVATGVEGEALADQPNHLLVPIACANRLRTSVGVHTQLHFSETRCMSCQFHSTALHFHIMKRTCMLHALGWQHTWGLVGEVDELGGFQGALSNAQVEAHVLAAAVGLLQDLQGEDVRVRLLHLSRCRGDVGRRAHVGRRIHQIPAPSPTIKLQYSFVQCLNLAAQLAHARLCPVSFIHVRNSALLGIVC